MMPEEYNVRDFILYWLASKHTHKQRPDLAELFPEDAGVVELTYAQVADIMETVRINCRQR